MSRTGRAEIRRLSYNLKAQAIVLMSFILCCTMAANYKRRVIMSGGSFDYKYIVLGDYYIGKMEDDELNEMMKDLEELLHDLEWYKSCDTSETDYLKTKNRFKDKWFGKRDERIVESIANKLQKAIDDIQKS
jgi:hypothetical protein